MYLWNFYTKSSQSGCDSFFFVNDRFLIIQGRFYISYQLLLLIILAYYYFILNYKTFKGDNYIYENEVVIRCKTENLVL